MPHMKSELLFLKFVTTGIITFPKMKNKIKVNGIVK